MERKEILPWFVYAIMFAGSITQWIPTDQGKIASYWIILAGVVLSLILVSVEFVKLPIGIGVIVMVYLMYAGFMAVMGTLIYMRMKYDKHLEKVDKSEHNPLQTYEILSGIMIMVQITIFAKIMDDAVRKKSSDVYKLMMMTSFGWILLILNGVLTGRMYVVVSRFLTDGFVNR